MHEVDVVGFNYGAPRYEQIVKKHPDWIVLGTETASTVSSRGTYHLPIEKYQKHPSRRLTGFDVIAPPWGYAPDVEFDMLDRLPTSQASSCGRDPITWASRRRTFNAREVA